MYWRAIFEMYSLVFGKFLHTGTHYVIVDVYCRIIIEKRCRNSGKPVGIQFYGFNLCRKLQIVHANNNTIICAFYLNIIVMICNIVRSEIH